MKKISLLFFSGIGYILASPLASAQTINIWQGTGRGGQTCNVIGPCNFCDAMIVISNIVRILLLFSIPIAVLMIVAGAILLAVAGGSPDKVKKGKDIITSAVIGVVIALLAWVVVNTLIHVLTGRPNFPWNQINCS